MCRGARRANAVDCLNHFMVISMLSSLEAPQTRPAVEMPHRCGSRLETPNQGEAGHRIGGPHVICLGCRSNRTKGA